jgi:hypothetical protein
MILPDFLIVGASKGGTVWMNECLREHPDVFLTPDTHEIFYFDRYFSRGPAWYAGYFREHAGEKRIGDVTSSYLAHRRVPSRVRSLIPEATVIASLRNPIDRAWSKYLHMWRKGQIPHHLTFWQACEHAPGILTDGEYWRALRSWRAAFPAKQIHLLVLDDARDDPFAYMRSVYEILGVDPEFRAASTTLRANEHRTPRSIWAAHVAYRCSELMHRHGLHLSVKIAKRLGLDRLVLHDRGVATKDPPPLLDEDRIRLRRYYFPDVSALSAEISRDLVSLWLPPAQGADGGSQGGGDGHEKLLHQTYEAGHN